jgi:hypothetical protein
MASSERSHVLLRACFVLALATCIQGCAAGPSLGPVRKVVITETGGEKPDDLGCRGFKLSLRQARWFLNHAAIITPYELHDSYNWFPCYVMGTAEIRGVPAEWEIRPGGTGSITILNEFTYSIVDPKQKTDLE